MTDKGIKFTGLPQAGTRYTFAVSTAGSNPYGDVESAVSRVNVSTKKFAAPKSVKVDAINSDFANGIVALTWRENATFANVITKYEVYQLTGKPATVTNQIEINSTATGRGTFISSSPLPLGKTTFYLRAVTADGIESLGTKVVVRVQ